MKDVYVCLQDGKKYIYKAWIHQHFKKFHPEIEPENHDKYIQVVQEQINNKVTVNNVNVPTSQTNNTTTNNTTTTQIDKCQNNCCQHCLEYKESLLKLTKRIDDLEKEIGKKEKNLCIACWEYESSFALQPCGHKLLCGTCAAILLASNPHCPFCRTKVVDIIQIWDASVCESAS